MNRIRPALIAVFCLLTILPLLAVGLLAYTTQAEHIHHDVADKLAAVRDKKAALIGLWLNEKLADGRILVESSRITGYLQRPSTSQLPLVRGRLARVAADYPGYVRAYVISASSGRIVASSRPSDEGKPPPARLAHSLRDRQHFTQPFLGPHGERAFMDVVSLVEERPGARPIGAVVVELDATKVMKPLVLDREGLGKTGEVVLVSQRGVALAPLRYQAPAPFKAQVRAKAVQLAESGGAGVIHSTDYRSAPVLAAYTNIPRVGWSLVVKQDESEVSQAIAHLRWTMGAAGGAALLVAVFVGVVLAGRLTRPLEALASAARRRARGERGVRVLPGGPTEVAEMAAAFNYMADELERAQDQVAAHAQWLATLLDQVPAGVVTLDAEGKIALVNQRARQIYPSPPDGLPMERHAEVLRLCYPDGSLYQPEKLPFSRSLLQGEVVRGEEVLIQRPDGSSSVLAYAAPLRDKEGRIVGALGAFEDITERKRMEDSLRESEERLQLALHGADLGLWDWDIAANKLHVNDRWATMLGYRPNEIPSQNDAVVHGWVNPDDLPRLEAALGSCFQQDASQYELEFRLRIKDGGWKWVLSRGRVTARDANGRPLRMTGTHLDITERKRVEDALRRANEELERLSRAKDEFLSLTSHELKTPVTSIKLFSELIARRPETLGPEMLQRLTRQADQLTALISDLLDLSRLQLGKMPIEKRPVELVSLLRETCERRASLCGSHVISCPDEAEQLVVAADPVRLEQVFANLLDNAHKYTPAGRRIWAKASRRAGVAVVKVQDEGIGISPEHLPHVFERFYKPGPQQSVYSGLGVGLYISKEIVERHGGSIWAESEGEGKGSRFFVELPLAED